MPPISLWAKAVFLLASVNAVGYLALPLIEGSLLYIGLKTSCCVLLALFAQISMPMGRAKKFLLAALLLSALGDLFLAIRSSDYFVQGLGSFLIAHILYISIFVRFKETASSNFTQRSLIALVSVVSITMIAVLWPELGALKAPVVIYIAVISLMAIAAILSSLNSLLVISGSFLFLISDATIAVNRFLEPVAYASTLIWITYFTAQVLLTFAIYRGKTTQKAQPLQSTEF
ncbi:MAG: lysoplasmalogenase [Sneathiella sp.]